MLKNYGVIGPFTRPPTIEPAVLRAERYESVRDDVQLLNVADTACCLDWLLMLVKNDGAVLSKLEAWLSTVPKKQAMTLAELAEMSEIANALSTTEPCKP